MARPKKTEEERYAVIVRFRDRLTDEIREAGEILEGLTAERAAELIAAGVVRKE